LLPPAVRSNAASASSRLEIQLQSTHRFPSEEKGSGDQDEIRMCSRSNLESPLHAVVNEPGSG